MLYILFQPFSRNLTLIRPLSRPSPSSSPFFYLKVKWREVRIPAFAERDQSPVALGYRLPRRRERRSDASVRPFS